MTVGFTKIQSDTLKFVSARIALTGVSPTYREIADGIGVKGRGRVCHIVDELVERKALVRLPKKARALALADQIIGGGFVVNPVPEVRRAVEAYARQHGITLRTAAEEALRAYFVEAAAG